MSTPKKENYTLQGLLNFGKVFCIVKKSFSLSARYEKPRIIILLILATLTALLPYIQNGLFGSIIDSVTLYGATGEGLDKIIFSVILLIIATAIPSVISLINTFVDTTFRFNILRNIELYFLEKKNQLDIATIESHEYQELTQKANERGNQTLYQIIRFSIDNFSNFIGVIASLIILGFIDKTLLLYAFIGVLPALFVQLRYGKDIWWIWDLNASNRRKYFNRRNHFLNTQSLIEIKLYQLGNFFLSEIKSILTAFDDELKSTERNKLLWELIALVVFITSLTLAVWRIISLALIGAMPIGIVFFAYTTYRGFKGALGEFFRRTGWISEFSQYVSYWLAIDALQPKINENEHTHVLTEEELPPCVEFKNVSFRYDKEANTAYAIKNLSFTVTPGQKVAIVGLSGAGKTTLIKLLCRIYDPEEGEILINGKNLKNISVRAWQQQLAVLFQDFTSYEFTAKEAIMIGNTAIKKDEERMHRAAHTAKADEFIERLPKQYDHLLWKGFEDGVELSKGERQRMALARVLYRESPITILDEPTASVDALSEQEIFKTLEQLPNDRTVFLISHRFSTVKNADSILVIEHGELIESGTHRALMSKKGRYEQLYTLQKESYNE